MLCLWGEITLKEKPLGMHEQEVQCTFGLPCSREKPLLHNHNYHTRVIEESGKKAKDYSKNFRSSSTVQVLFGEQIRKRIVFAWGPDLSILLCISCMSFKTNTMAVMA